MIRRCSDAGLPEPEFTDSRGFKTIIWRAKPSGLPESLPGDVQSKVIKLLATGPMPKIRIVQGRTKLSKLN